jgi:DNA-binding CsgD family transcriptional regulator
LTEHIPEGLRDVIGQRLSRLSDRTNQVLAVASVLGREFELEALLGLVQLSEIEVIDALEEAARVALIQEQPIAHTRVGYRFTHAFFRQTLYAEISAPRRIRWHQQAGTILEAVYANQLEEHAAELAEHFAHSSDPVDLGKAVTYGQLAARRAMSVYAYGEAVRQLERALDVEDVLDPKVGTRRCELLLELGEAVLPTDEPLRVAESLAPAAFSLAESCQDSPRAARAAIQALDALFRSKSGTTVNMSEWVEAADRHAAIGTPERVYADSYLGINVLQTGRRREGSVYLRRAVERARELGDDVGYVTAAGYALTFLNALSDFLFVERIAQEFQTRPHPGVRSGDLAAGLESVARRLLARGDREQAEQAWRELSRLAEESRDPVVRIMETTARSTIAFVDGHLEEALVLGESALGLADAAGLAPTWNTTLRRARLLPACIRVYLGRPAEVSLTDNPATAGSRRPGLAEGALLLSLLHQCEEALAIRADFGDVGLAEDDTAVFILAFFLEVSIRCGDAKTAAALLPRLSSLGNHLQAWYHPTSFGRLLGEAAAMLGHIEAARAYLLQALEVDRKVRFRPDLALTRLDLAELLLEHFPDQRGDAIDLLQLAIAEFADMGMQPSLEYALQVQRALAGATAGSPTPTLDSEVAALTAREREVASLIACGLSNRDIAAALVITEMTTEVHVKHILAKLGFRSRSQVAVWATHHGLAHPVDAAD